MPTSERLREVAEGWEPRRRPVDVTTIVEGRTSTRSRGRLAVAAIAACGALVAGAAVVVFRDDGGSEPTQLDVVEDPPATSAPAPSPDLPPHSGVEPEWGSPTKVEVVAGGLVVMSSPPWDGSPVAEGAGGVSRVDLDSGAATPLAGIAGVSDMAVNGGDVWLAAGSPERAVRLDPTTGEVLDEIALPPVVDATVVTIDPQGTVGETGPLLVAPSADGAWVLRPTGVVTEVFAVRAGEAPPERPTAVLGGSATGAIGLGDGTLVTTLGGAGLATVTPDGVAATTPLPGFGVLTQVVAAGGEVWVAGYGGQASNDWAVVQVDPRSREPIGDTVRTGWSARLVGGDGAPRLLATGAVLRLPGLEEETTTPVGARAGTVVGDEVWTTGAWWIQRDGESPVALPGGTIAAPSVQERSATESPSIPVELHRDGDRTWFEVVDLDGTRIRVEAPSSIPSQGAPRATQSAGRSDGSRSTSVHPSRAPRPEACEEPCETTVVDLPNGGVLEVFDAGDIGLDDDVGPQRVATLWLPGWRVDLPTEGYSDEQLVAAAGEITVETTPEGFAVLRTADPALGPGTPSVDVTFQRVGVGTGLKIGVTRGCEASLDDPLLAPFLPPTFTCRNDVMVVVKGAPGLADDVLSTIDARIVG
jgi:hypothetical protein